MGTRRLNREGSIRELPNGRFECLMQSKYPNPKSKDASPKRVKKTGDTREEAIRNTKQALEAWEAAYKEHNDITVNRSKTFGSYVFDFINEYKKDEIEPSTLLSYNRSYQQYIKKYAVARHQLHELTERMFELYYQDLASNYAEASFSNAVYLCRATGDWLVKRKLLSENYAKLARVKIERVKEFETLDEEDIKKVFDKEDVQKFVNAYYDGVDSDYVLVTLFMLETGIRVEEFPAIRMKDFDFDKKIIKIRRALSQKIASDFQVTEQTKTIPTESYEKGTKTKQDGVYKREVKMTPFCLEISKRMMAKTNEKCKKNTEEYFYPSFITGKRRSIETMEVGFASLCKKLDIDRGIHKTKGGHMVGLNLKALRHTSESIANENQKPSVLSAYMRGHSLATSVGVYTHFSEDVVSRFDMPSPKEIVMNESRDDINGLTDAEQRELLRLLKKLQGGNE